jgi:hypothetical protein
MNRGTTRNHTENFEPDTNTQISEGITKATQDLTINDQTVKEQEEEVTQPAYPQQRRNTTTKDHIHETTTDSTTNEATNNQKAQQSRQRQTTRNVYQQFNQEDTIQQRQENTRHEIPQNIRIRNTNNNNPELIRNNTRGHQNPGSINSLYNEQDTITQRHDRQLMQQCMQQYDTTPTKKNESWGASINSTPPTTFRIYFQNVNGLQLRTTESKWKNHLEYMQEKGISISGLAETNTNWKHKNIKNQHNLSLQITPYRSQKIASTHLTGPTTYRGDVYNYVLTTGRAG